MIVFAPQLQGAQRPASGRPVRRSDAVVEDLVERIVAGDIAVGRAVPTEPTLCSAYGVSRTVVREAVKALEEKGLVTAFQGVGTLVSRQESWNLLDRHVLAAIVRHDEQYDVLDQLIAVRSARESDMAAEAARRATRADLDELSALMDALDASIRNPNEMDELDVAFHEWLMLVSGNVLGGPSCALCTQRHGKASATSGIRTTRTAGSRTNSIGPSWTPWRRRMPTQQRVPWPSTSRARGSVAALAKPHERPAPESGHDYLLFRRNSGTFGCVVRPALRREAGVDSPEPQKNAPA